MGNKRLWRVLLTLFVVAMPSISLAMKDEAVENAPVYNRYDVGPTQYRLTMDAGQTQTYEIKLYNYYNQSESFGIGVEDVDAPTEVTVGSYAQYLGSGVARYGAKDWIKPEVETITLENGHVAFFTVKVTTPADAEPGDYYAAMMIRRIPQAAESETTDKSYSGSVNIESRVAVMFYIQINGDIKISTDICEFKTSQSWYGKAPIDMLYAVKNDGNISVETEGTITIKNLINRTTDTIDIAKQKVLRGTTRTNTINWQPKHFAMGRYTATLELNHEYDNSTMQKEIVFWIIPWREIVLTVVIVVALIIVIYYIRRRFIIDIKINRIFGQKKK